MNEEVKFNYDTCMKVSVPIVCIVCIAVYLYFIFV